MLEQTSYHLLGMQPQYEFRGWGNDCNVVLHNVTMIAMWSNSHKPSYKNKVWRAVLSWIFRARKAWWSHLQARRRSLRAC